MHIRIVVSAALALVGATLGVAALANADRTARPTLRIVSTYDSEVLDPALNYNELGWALERATCTTLLRFSAEGTTTVPRPDGANGFPLVSKDGRTYTFTVRRGLRFSDGSPISAASYARSIRRLLDARTQSNDLRTAFAGDISSVSARGRTLSVHLAAARADILTRIAAPMFCPVPADLPVDPAGIDLTIGSGPYRLVRRSAGREIVLAPNRFYRGPRPKRFASIVVRIGGTVDALYRQTAGNGADVLWDNLAGDAPAASQAVQEFGVGKRRLFSKRQQNIFYLAMNTKSPLFRENVALRRAVNFALDRHEIVRQTQRPFGYARTDQVLPFSMPGFVDAHLYPIKKPNLRAAQKLARGHLRGGKAVLYSLSGPFFERQAQIIVYNLRQIGIDVEVKTFGREPLYAKLSDPKEPYDLAGPLLWFIDYPDPANVIDVFFGPERPGTVNVSHFDNPAFRARIRRTSRLTGAARYEAYARLERDILRQQAPVAGLYTAGGLAYVGPRVRCVSMVFGDIDLERLCIKG